MKAIFESPAIPPDDYHKAMAVLRPEMQALYDAAFEAYRLDAILMPTTPLTARKIGEDEEVTLEGAPFPTFPTYIRNTDPASNIGAPSISLPLPVDGLPVGFMLEARQGQDNRLLEIAAAVERVVGRP